MRRILITLAFLSIAAADGLHAQVARRPFLFKDARGELAAARARGDADVLLVIAAMPGENARAVRRIEGMGGTIQFRDDDVDYLRARVPVDSVEALVVDAAIHSVDVSIRSGRVFGDAAAAPLRAAPELPGPPMAAVDTPPVWPPVLEPTPLINRYDPLSDIGAARFREQNPTYDGRGVTVAIIDMNLDPLLPELQVARTLDGAATKKIIAYETVLDAKEEPDGRWLEMDSLVTAAGGTFTFDGKTYTAPRDGRFRFDRFDEEKHDTLARAGLDKDANRDGNPEGSSRLFGVLWDEATDDVWVDTDQDLSFADERALTDYARRPEFGIFGTDDPDTPIRESIAFGVQIDRDKKNVALNLGVASHASLVVGAAVASRGDAGRFDGVAPGARLANFAEGGSAYGQTEAVIRAMKHPDVEVVFLEQSSLITRSYLLRDGRLVPTVIYERLIALTGKALVVPTHNYPVLGAPDDFVVAKNAIGIGGHESKENFFRNHGVRVEHDDNLLITGGYGPMGNGALEPDVISPSNYVSTGRGFLEGTAIAGLFQLPPGYTIAGGTSTATPTAAGAVALLMSAAKQEGVDYDAARILHALRASARRVPHLPVYKQGNGVVNVAGAWEILKAMDGAPAPVEIEVRAPVRHPLSGLLPTPHEGVGLYERDGWSVGDRGERTVTVTRTSGPAQPMTFRVRWIGNDAATFASPATITLPLNTPTPLRIDVAPDSAGVHSAILALSNESVPGDAHRMLATIVATEPFTAENGYRIEKKAEVPRPGMQSFFYNVPEGVTALRVDLQPAGRAVSLAITGPDTRAQRGVPQGSGRITHVVESPMPGLWEVRLSDIADTRTFDWEQAKKEEPVPPSKATLTVATIGVTTAVDDGAIVTPPSGAGNATFDVGLSNAMAKFTAAARNAPLGAARRADGTIAAKQQRIFDIDVPAGSTALLVRVSAAAAADLDVYVFDCTGDKCDSEATDADLVGDEYVRIENPDSGSWKVVVDAWATPAGGTAFEYLDVVFNPTFGAVSFADVASEKDSGAAWTARANTWINAALPAGRTPFVPLFLELHQGSSRFVVDVFELRADPVPPDGTRRR